MEREVQGEEEEGREKARKKIGEAEERANFKDGVIGIVGVERLKGAMSKPRCVPDEECENESSTGSKDRGWYDIQLPMKGDGRMIVREVE